MATVERLLKKDELGADEYVSWAPYHASMTQPVAHPPGISSLLPLLVAKADTTSMARHAMIVLKHATEYLNPGQIPVTNGDKPLYARMKLLQLEEPNMFGEVCVTLGGLHIEVAVFRGIGNLLHTSGWTSALVDAAGIATQGKAESFFTVLPRDTDPSCSPGDSSRIVQYCRRKQESCLIQQKAEQHLDFFIWCEHMADEYPQFKCWSLIKKYELTALLFVRSIRDGDIDFYGESIGKLLIIVVLFTNLSVTVVCFLIYMCIPD